MLKNTIKFLIFILFINLFSLEIVFSDSMFDSMKNIMSQTISQIKTEEDTLRYKSIPILMFHHISDEENSILTSTAFREYMESIKNAGYETVLYKDLLNFVNGEGQLPEKPIIVSFDDGYESNYIYAYPILKKMNMKAEIAVVGYTVGFDLFPDTSIKIIPHFTWIQALEMVESGVISINSHSYNLHQHATTGQNVTRLGVVIAEGERKSDYLALLKADAIAANRAIKNNLGYVNIAYTYPYGAYSDMTESVFQSLNIPITVTNTSGISEIEVGNTNSLKLLKRLPCDNLNLNIIKMIEQAYQYM
ncbi:MAG: hypothetical protein EOM59_03750 [Clostridia bacterium]|nr:hypothetical protein [Clostridia bacterium]